MADALCWPEDVLHVQVDVEAVDEEGRLARLQTQSAFEDLDVKQRERKINDKYI